MNLNSLQSRSGNQLPFTSINLGTCTSEAGRMVSHALLDTCYKGLGPNYTTSIFPCVIFQCKSGINRKEGEPNYDLFRKSLKCTAKRIYPNYGNCDWQNSVNWKKTDMQVKQEIIDSLNPEQYAKLVEQLEKNPELQKRYGLELVDE